MVKVFLPWSALYDGATHKGGRATMNVGILVETGRDGLEAIIVPRICQLLREEYNADFQETIIPMTNKVLLLEGCGTAAKSLLKTGHNRVVALWDERPAWPDRNDPPCRKRDRETAIERIERLGLAIDPVFLVCIRLEFETWLLHDHDLISRILSRPTYKANVPRQSKPEQYQNPKGTMTSLFKQYGGQVYGDVQFAKRFANALTSLNRLGRCKTFKRFALKIADVEL